MGFLQRILSNRIEIPIDPSIPHLTRKKKPKKGALPKPKRLILHFTLESFDDPLLPTIVLRPPTPLPHNFGVEERLFERSGAVFILRKRETSAQAQLLQVPVESPVAQVSEDVIQRSGSEVEAAGGDEDGVGKDEGWKADYCAYVAGIDEGN